MSDSSTDDRMGATGTAGTEQHPEDTPKSREWIPWAVAAVIIVLGLGGWILFGLTTTATVPDVVGMTTEDAEQAIEDAGFTVGSVEESGTADVDEGIVLEQSPEADIGAIEGSEIDLIVSVELLVEVPDVTGMTEEEAVAALDAEGFATETISYYVDAVEAGLVAGQLPEAGEAAAPESVVGILVSLGSAPEKVEVVKVPDVVGQQESAAISALTSVGLTVRIYYSPSEDVPQGAVIDQEPEGGATVGMSTTVVILVSTGGEPEPPEPSAVPVPDVKDMTEEDATTALADVGLVAQSAPIFSDDVAAGTVAVQFPAAETEVLVGSVVAIAISQGPETPDAVEVPDVVGMSSDDALAAIEKVGLEVIAFESPTPEGLPDGDVFAQLPAGGAKVEPGSTMILLVSNGETGDIDPLPMARMSSLR